MPPVIYAGNFTRQDVKCNMDQEGVGGTGVFLSTYVLHSIV